MKNKRDSSIKYQDMMDKFNKTRVSFLNSGSFDQTPEVPFESETVRSSENNFHKRHKSVQPAFKGHVHKTNLFSLEEESLNKSSLPVKIFPSIKHKKESVDMNKTF
mgnify:CR=1 FL=1